MFNYTNFITNLKESSIVVLVISLSLFILTVDDVQAQPFAYVTNNRSANVSVIDIAKNSVITTVDVGSSPTGIAITPDGSFAYVANQTTRNVSVIDIATNSVVKTISLSVMPVFISITPDGAFAYVTSFNWNSVLVIDIATNSVVNTVSIFQPSYVAFTPDGAFAYVTSWGAAAIFVIDIATNSVVNTIRVGVHVQGREIAFTPDGAFAVVASWRPNGGVVSIIEVANGRVVATVGSGSRPTGVAITPDGTIAVVTNQTSNSVSVIDIATRSVVATVDVGSGPWGIDITSDGALAGVVNRGSNSISVIDLATSSVVATIDVGTGPMGIAITPSSPNAPPIADAGLSQTVLVGANVQLDGSGSSDADDDPLTYSWSLFSKPGGSFSTLTDATAVNPSFSPDVAGEYVVELIVNDGTADSDPAQVTITAQTAQQAAQDVIGNIETLLADALLSAGQGNSLIKKLESAIKKLDKEQKKVAANMLNAFINHVNSLIDEGVLSSTDGDPLISAVRDIVDSLSAGLAKRTLVSNNANPDNYALFSNFPNPFNPTTRISFVLPEAGQTRIIIYDQMGREVARLVDGYLGAGNHSVTWNASNVASGMYFYRLQASDFVQTRKMVLLK